jgi:hypothetical protein
MLGSWVGIFVVVSMWLQVLLWGVLAAVVPCALGRPPNILMIVIDDLGWNGLCACLASSSTSSSLILIHLPAVLPLPQSQLLPRDEPPSGLIDVVQRD